MYKRQHEAFIEKGVERLLEILNISNGKALVLFTAKTDVYKRQELVEEGDGFEEDQDEYTAENIFFVPENARWSAIAAAAHTPDIGTVIDLSLIHIFRRIRLSKWRLTPLAVSFLKTK